MMLTKQQNLKVKSFKLLKLFKLEIQILEITIHHDHDFMIKKFFLIHQFIIIKTKKKMKIIKISNLIKLLKN